MKVSLGSKVVSAVLCTVTVLLVSPAAKVSAAIYLSPPVTMLWAWALFDEPLTAIMFMGLVVTLAGVWLTMRDDRNGVGGLEA